MRVRVQKPAAMVLPPDVHQVLLLNRSQGSTRATLEGILTGQTPGLQTMLTTECLGKMQQGLQQANRYDIIQYDKIMQAASGSSTGFGEALPWPEVNNICLATHTDAIISLEYFEGDFIVTQALAANPTQGILARGVSRATIGIRIYYPKLQSVVYQDDFRRSLTWTEQSGNYFDALAKLLKGPDALREVARSVGATFGDQFVSYSYWQPRLMFKGKKNAYMTRGYRLALSNDWAAARDSWSRAYDLAPTPKQRGRAAYNIALAYEVLGNLPEARQWAKTAYVEHGDPRAQRYGYILDDRIALQSVLDSQNR
jgi:tetratricopeptide (TPR) repeat protein